MAKGVGKIQDLPKGERYGAAVVSHNRYPTESDGRGATSPIPANEMPVGPGKNDTEAQMAYLAAQRGG